jgi:DNA-binding MarR family transcriptional regulator
MQSLISPLVETPSPRRLSVRRASSGATLDFAAISSAWRDSLPRTLERESPAEILQLLAIVELANGISQADLRRKLDTNQSRLSKLLAKLINSRLVEQTIDRGDRRLQFLRSTTRGQNRLRMFEPDLSEAALQVLAGGKLELLP